MSIRDNPNTCRDNLSQRSIGAAINHHNQLHIFSPVPHHPATSPANTHSALHSHSQQLQQHRNMATLSPSRARTTLGCSPTFIDHEQRSPQRLALIPRSALPEIDLQELTHDSSCTASSSAAQVLQSLDSNVAPEGTLLLPAEYSQNGACMRTSLPQQRCWIRSV
jgi:hypothetical protein